MTLTKLLAEYRSGSRAFPSYDELALIAEQGTIQLNDASRLNGVPDVRRIALNNICINGHLNDALDYILRSNSPDAIFNILGELARKSIDEYIASLSAIQPPSQIDEMGNEIARLQDALAFWMPMVGGPDKVAERLAKDAFLLIGYDGNNDEPSAEKLGWIQITAQDDQIQVIRFSAADGNAFYAEHTGMDQIRETVQRMGNCDQVDLLQMTKAEYAAIPTTNESYDLFKRPSTGEQA